MFQAVLDCGRYARECYSNNKSNQAINQLNLIHAISMKNNRFTWQNKKYWKVLIGFSF